MDIGSGPEAMTPFLGGLAAIGAGCFMYYWGYREDEDATKIGAAKSIESFRDLASLGPPWPAAVAVRGRVNTRAPKQCELSEEKAVIHEIVEEEVLRGARFGRGVVEELVRVRYGFAQREWFLEEESFTHGDKASSSSAAGAQPATASNFPAVLVKVENAGAAPGLSACLSTEQRFTPEDFGRLAVVKALVDRGPQDLVKCGVRKSEAFLPVGAVVTVIGEVYGPSATPNPASQPTSSAAALEDAAAPASTQALPAVAAAGSGCELGSESPAGRYDSASAAQPNAMLEEEQPGRRAGKTSEGHVETEASSYVPSAFVCRLQFGGDKTRQDVGCGRSGVTLNAIAAMGDDSASGSSSNRSSLQFSSDAPLASSSPDQTVSNKEDRSTHSPVSVQDQPDASPDSASPDSAPADSAPAVALLGSLLGPVLAWKDSLDDFTKTRVPQLAAEASDAAGASFRSSVVKFREEVQRGAGRMRGLMGGLSSRMNGGGQGSGSGSGAASDAADAVAVEKLIASPSPSPSTSSANSALDYAAVFSRQLSSLLSSKAEKGHPTGRDTSAEGEVFTGASGVSSVGSLVLKASVDLPDATGPSLSVGSSSSVDTLASEASSAAAGAAVGTTVLSITMAAPPPSQQQQPWGSYAYVVRKPVDPEVPFRVTPLTVAQFVSSLRNAARTKRIIAIGCGVVGTALLTRSLYLRLARAHRRAALAEAEVLRAIAERRRFEAARAAAAAAAGYSLPLGHFGTRSASEGSLGNGEGVGGRGLQSQQIRSDGGSGTGSSVDRLGGGGGSGSSGGDNSDQSSGGSCHLQVSLDNALKSQPGGAGVTGVLFLERPSTNDVRESLATAESLSQRSQASNLQQRSLSVALVEGAYCYEYELFESQSGDAATASSVASTGAATAVCQPPVRRRRLLEPCVVCLERDPCQVFTGCGHLCCCDLCVSRLQGAAGIPRCPMCRTAGRPMRIYGV